MAFSLSPPPQLPHPLQNFRWTTLVIGLLLALIGCTSVPGTPADTADALPPIFPDYTEVTVPENIAPMNFGIKGATAIKAMFSLDGTQRLTVCGKSHIDIDEADWHSLLAEAKGKKLTVQVSAWTAQHPQGVAYRAFDISIAEPIDEWLVYRLIDPGYDSWGHIGIYQRCLSNFDEEALITNHDNRARCVNCHSFADYSPKSMMYHQRSVDPATVILHDGIEDRVDLRKIGPHKPGLYCKWHPSGRYIIFSTNGTHQSFLDRGKKVLEVYDTHSSLFLYDVKTHEITTDSLLYNDNAMQTFATFSPDGRWLYYCSAPQLHDYPADYERTHYSIVRMGFDVATGHFSGQADTIYNARTDGGSAAFPRISPDGRHLLFTLADCGTFPVYHPEARLEIIDLESRQRVNTDILSSPQAESYHDWSSSGHWMVFQSRHMDGRHTRLMIAYFGHDGTPRKPFMLPQRDPEDNRTRIWSYNVPEFVREHVDHEFH